MKFNTHGHTLPTPDKYLEECLVKNLERLQERFRDVPATWSGECLHCGRNIHLALERGSDVVEVTMQSEWDIDTHTTTFHPVDAECPVPTLEPVTLRFTSKSGRVALANDLREHFDWGEKGHRFNISTQAGKIQYMRWFEQHGYLTGFIGSTSAYFLPREGGLDIIDTSCDGFDLEDPPSDAVGHTSAELWWFAIVDMDDLPEGATDSFDRKFDVYELPGGPGEYELIYESVGQDYTRVATLRPVGGGV